MKNFLTQNQEILDDFYNIKEKPYDEIELELKIIELESNLKLNLSLNESLLFDKIVLKTKQLQKLQSKRLIEFIKKQTPQ